MSQQNSIIELAFSVIKAGIKSKEIRAGEERHVFSRTQIKDLSQIIYQYREKGIDAICLYIFRQATRNGYRNVGNKLVSGIRSLNDFDKISDLMSYITWMFEVIPHDYNYYNRISDAAGFNDFLNIVMGAPEQSRR